ncbi:hypothetical protein [Brevibacillus laterosporus]|uniref:Uncharacterized protein n=1 Tax=Brevibacillus laterosporus TaxID=1465 RepID=A0AAP3GAD4_BRELA|nr:hypothetical protein [Brevibacillus laterosporus]MCR8982291.1 hypothetical protein [Brevibacillus laterosporus]MCZ0809446.1 hypothetical protein [Brevibacillus laterosporus]MCZ0827839.1 hypothetical protein [Brevibacillus laterosporus]MCZ0851779.1 hypothetical protein [Brevibacillus laterosporus]
MPYPRSEQETVLTYEYETRQWLAYSCVPAHIRKLTDIGRNVTILDRDESGEPSAIRAELSSKQVRMMAERVMTEEQRVAAADRLRLLNVNRAKTNVVEPTG